jgi:hypothetical protein
VLHVESGQEREPVAKLGRYSGFVHRVFLDGMKHVHAGIDEIATGRRSRSWFSAWGRLGL